MECTVVSYVPFAISAFKPGLAPNTFHIPPSGNEPSLLNVKDGFRQLFDAEMRPMSYPVLGEEIAASIVNDYTTSLIFSEGNKGPAIFFLPGSFKDASVIEKTFKDKVTEAKNRQTEWFKVLVQIADDDWQIWHQHKTITDMQRHSARALNLKREWLQDNPDSFTKCAACMTLVSTEAAVCFACKAILSKEKYSKFEFVK